MKKSGVPFDPFRVVRIFLGPAGFHLRLFMFDIYDVVFQPRCRRFNKLSRAVYIPFGMDMWKYLRRQDAVILFRPFSKPVIRINQSKKQVEG